MLASYSPSSYVCPSFRLSVRHKSVFYYKTAKPIESRKQRRTIANWL